MPEWIEQLESRSINSSGGRGTGSRSYVASGYSTVKSVFDAFGRTTDVAGLLVPAKGSGHPEFKGLVAKDFTVTKVSGHSDLWKIDWQYEMVTASYDSAPAFPIEELPNEVGYTELSSEIRAEFVLAFREGATIPEGGNPDNNGSDPEQDIGGTKVDAGGNPTSIVRRIQELTFTETVNVPAFGTYGTFRFKRNSKPFEGAVAGSVLYRGASVRRTGLEVFVVSHSFVQDEDFHLQQQPVVDQDGRPIPDADGHAEKVYHIQPFKDTDDFNNLSENF